MEEHGIDVDERDILRTPPSREFLEEHVGENNFLDFLSRRSPVWKQRPLPKTRREAIDVMMENPNLIKRPVFIKGRKVVFGFDREALSHIAGSAKT